MKIVFTGGGTGGHIFPIIAIVQALKEVIEQKGQEVRKDVSLSIYYLGPKDDVGGRELFLSEGMAVRTLLTGKTRRYFTPLAILQTLIDIFVRLPIGLWQAFWWLFFNAPDVVFSKGGHGSFPVVVAARLLQIPVFVHESDAVAGRANRIAASMAQEVFASFPDSEGLPRSKMLVVGNPVRQDLLTGSSEEAQNIFKLTGEKPVLLILGGSQGATRLNDLIMNILPEWLKDFELIHQVGSQNIDEIEKEVQLLLKPELARYYHPFGFLKEREMAHALKAAHLAAARAGAGTIFELAAAGKPSILIPLPESAQQHQLKNAYAFAQKGGAVVIEHANLTPHFLLEKIKYLLANPKELQALAQGAADFAKPRAGKVIAEYLLAYLTT